MNAIRLMRHVLFAALTMLASAPATAGGDASGRALVPGYVYVPWGYGIYGDCGYYGGCFDTYRAARSYEFRREQVRRQREQLATPKPPPDLWDGPWGYTRRLPPPTPDSEIQPQYRDSGQVLPQYRDSGSP